MEFSSLDNRSQENSKVIAVEQPLTALPFGNVGRGNSRLMRAWRVVADATAYVLLFITISGIYLWVALKAERRIGVALMLTGAITF